MRGVMGRKEESEMTGDESGSSEEDSAWSLVVCTLDTREFFSRSCRAVWPEASGALGRSREASGLAREIAHKLACEQDQK